MSARAPGYAASTASLVKIPGDSALVDLVLRRSATLTGKVVDPSGKPVSHAFVIVLVPVEGNPGQYRSRMPSDGRTDPNGAFKLTEIEPGRILLMAEAKGWASSDPMTIEVESGESVSDLVLTLHPASEDSRDR